MLLTALGPAPTAWATDRPTTASPAPTDPPMLTVPSAGDPAPSDTANEFVDLERDLSECVGNSLAKPGCGRAPTHSGDRGSPIQWAVFALMGLGIAFIGWRIVVGARRPRMG